MITGIPNGSGQWSVEPMDREVDEVLAGSRFFGGGFMKDAHREELDEEESIVDDTLFSAFGLSGTLEQLTELLNASVDKYQKEVFTKKEKTIIKKCLKACICDRKELHFFGNLDDENRLKAVIDDLHNLIYNLLFFLCHHDRKAQTMVQTLYKNYDEESIINAVNKYIREEYNYEYNTDTDVLWDYSNLDRQKIYKHKTLRRTRDVQERLEIMFDVNEDKKDEKMEELEKFFNEYKPHKIKEFLDRYVVGQDDAKMAAAYILYSHVAMILNPELTKTNGMFIGGSGTGKTFIWRILKKISPVDIFIRDASQLTAAGFTGDDAVGIAKGLFNGNNRETGFILIWDEADKMIRPKHDSQQSNAAVDVQATLLKMLEDGEASGRRLSYDFSKVSMVLLGVFEGVTEREQKTIGFVSPRDRRNTSLIQGLIDFGTLPEILGRISLFACLSPLSDDDFMRVINYPNGPLMRLKKRFKATDGISLELEEGAKKELVNYAHQTGTGARGIETLLTSASIRAFNESVMRGTHTILITREDILEGFRTNAM